MALWVLWAILVLPFDLEPTFVGESEADCLLVAAVARARYELRAPGQTSDIFRCSPLRLPPATR